MKIRCISNKGAYLRQFEYKEIKNREMLGRFGSTAISEYNQIEVGTEYLVMGLIVFESYQAYLIDDNGFISACPCQLFEIIDNELSQNWHFRMTEKDENIYPFVQAIFGYSELCSDKKAYENLIIEKDENTSRIYFRRKIELEKELSE